ncbi:MAG: type II toxin-antitoxin system death-on-curing family toxin [Chloroflexaceae bacterium]|nr:type II toxin-antitoxin system death-on-curing family toxin [Chloroflexaceae bacterium]
MAAAQHLTLHDIIDIRDMVASTANIDDDPTWRFELVNANGLITALTTPFQAAFGAEAFPSVVDKAGALVFLLIANHPFRDGNKRIAAAALRLFLERNGRRLHATPPELYTFTMNVMQGRLRDAYINTWIEQHCTE